MSRINGCHRSSDDILLPQSSFKFETTGRYIWEAFPRSGAFLFVDPSQEFLAFDHPSTRIMDGEPVTDPKAFARRISKMMEMGLVV